MAPRTPPPPTESGLLDLDDQVKRLARRQHRLSRRRDQLADELRLFRQLFELDLRLESRFGLQSILQHIAGFATREIGFQRSVLLLDDRNDGVFTVRAMDGYFSDAPQKRVGAIRIPTSSTIAACLRDGQRIVVPSEDLPPEVAQLGADVALDRWMAFPLLGLSKNLVGLILAGNTDAESRSYAPADPDGRAGAGLATLAQKAAMAINNSVLHWDLAIERNLLEAKVSERTAELQRAYDQIQQDVFSARDFQQSILSTPPDVAGVQIEIVYEPCELVGGDIYDVWASGPRVRVFLADATGHGVGASLTTMFIKSAYDLAKGREASPAMLLRRINDEIAKQYGRLEMIFTAVCADFDLATGRLLYATAGHPAPCLWRAGQVLELESGGPFVGMIAGAEFPEREAPFEPGNAAYFYTDGLFEQWSADGTEFGEQRVLEIIAAAAANGRPEGAAICADLKRFVADRPLADDVTFLGVRRSGQ